MSAGCTQDDFCSAESFVRASFAEISKAFTKASAFSESVMLKFAKMLEVAIIMHPYLQKYNTPLRIVKHPAYLLKQTLDNLSFCDI